jgi:hypothetical protein
VADFAEHGEVLGRETTCRAVFGFVTEDAAA